MDKQRQSYNIILMLISFFCSGCINNAIEEPVEKIQTVSIRIGGQGYDCKSATPDEQKITDISLMIFDEYGTIEEYRWIPSSEIASVIKNGLSMQLTAGKTYSFFGCVNFGYQIYADSCKDLDKIRYHMTYPDDFRGGVPMYIAMPDVRITPKTSDLTIQMKRLMSKISIRIDRSSLNKDVKMRVVHARIGNCPKVVKVFEDSRITDPSECFPAGYSKNEFDIYKINEYNSEGISGEVALFMLENMQGTIDIPDGSNKEFPEGDIRRKICSYVEMEIEYLSSEKASWSKPLKYRFYLGENAKDLNVERNCHYHITIKPENDGLSKDGWCIDKSGICTFIQEIHLSNPNLSFEYKGQSIPLKSTILPENATMRILSWSTSNDKVAVVSDTGVITATGEGKCTITCTSLDNAGATASCEVTCKFKDSYMKLFPSEYIVGDIGDKVHIWCEFFPPNTPFNIGLEELEFDKNRGIYDYIIDKDGHGVVLTLKNPGRGMLYMSAGYPINDSKMVVIEVNKP